MEKKAAKILMPQSPHALSPAQVESAPEPEKAAHPVMTYWI
jgi:hypothetical protein